MSTIPVLGYNHIIYVLFRVVLFFSFLLPFFFKTLETITYTLHTHTRISNYRYREFIIKYSCNRFSSQLNYILGFYCVRKIRVPSCHHHFSNEIVIISYFDHISAKKKLNKESPYTCTFMG